MIAKIGIKNTKVIINGDSDVVEIGMSDTTEVDIGSLTNISVAIPDTSPILILSTTGTNGATMSVYIGNRDPNGVITADAGSIYVRVGGTSSGVYQNRSAVSGTTWVAL